MRYSLFMLLTVIVVVAVASASLVSHTEWWPSVLLTLAVGSLMFFLVQAILSRQSTRSFAIGFVVFCACYTDSEK